MRRFYLLSPCLFVLFLAALLGTILPARPALAQFDKDYTRTINGAALHFRVRGADKGGSPYLLILHGGPGFSAHMFYPWGQASDIEGWFNVVYLDQRGCGQSERLKVADPLAPKPGEVKNYTISTLIADIEGVRQFLKVDKWYVLGHSWGGMLGLEYVTAHPEHVLGYIHLDGLISQPTAQESALDFAKAYYSKQLAAATDDAAKQKARAALDTATKARDLAPGPERLSAWYRLVGSDSAFFQALYYADAAKATAYQKAITETLQRYKVPAASALFAPEPSGALVLTEHYAARDDTPLLAKVTVPTLILHGAEDHVVPPAQAQMAHAAIKGSTLIFLNSCGHFPFVDQPEQTKAAILAFLSAGAE